MIKKISPNILANIITFLRVAAIPALITSEIQERCFQALLIMLLICFSDIIDGLIVRMAGKESQSGKISDIIADFVVVFSVFLCLYSEKQLPQYILILMFISFFSFVGLFLIRKQIIKNRIGQYTGAVCFIGILLILIGRIYFSTWLNEIQYTAYIVITITFSLSIIENILFTVRIIIDEYIGEEFRKS